MTDEEIEKLIIEQHLPEWAVGHADPNKWELGAQLCTKDGRLIGNAHITGVMLKTDERFQDAHEIITDAGTRMVMTAHELTELFYPPRWLSDPIATLARFERIDHLDY